MQGRTRHLPWLAVGAVAAPLMAKFTAVDTSATAHKWVDSVNGTASTTIATSGTVTFDYPVAPFPSTHNVNFTSTNTPATCQRIGGASAPPPRPTRRGARRVQQRPRGRDERRLSRRALRKGKLALTVKITVTPSAGGAFGATLPVSLKLG